MNTSKQARIYISALGGSVATFAGFVAAGASEAQPPIQFAPVQFAPVQVLPAQISPVEISPELLRARYENWTANLSLINAEVQVGPLTFKPQNFQVADNIAKTLTTIAGLPEDLTSLAVKLETGEISSTALPQLIAQDINVHLATLTPVETFRDNPATVEGYAEVSYRPSFGKWTPFFGEARFMGTMDNNGATLSGGDIDLKDVFYTVGYSDWRNDTFELKYTNFSGEDWLGDISHPAFGTLEAKYKFGLENDQLGALALDENTRLACYVGGELRPRYRDNNNDEQVGKRAAKSGCTLALWKRFFVDAGADFYADGQQTSGDRDYFYAFGWSDWRPGRINIVYENYANNRFPWNDGVPNVADFWDGTLKVSMNLKPFDKRKY